MKIEIDLMDNGIPYLLQMEAVDIYIKHNTIKSIGYNFFGNVVVNKDDLTLYTEIDIQPTKKIGGFETGTKIKFKNQSFHVSCKKTKGGVYKFNVWLAG